MQAAILRSNPAAEFFTPELCYINELSNTANDSELSIARARVAPGVTTRWHRLKDTSEPVQCLDHCAQVQSEATRDARQWHALQIMLADDFAE